MTDQPVSRDDANAAAAQQVSGIKEGTPIDVSRTPDADLGGELAHRQAQAGQPIGSTSTDPDALLKMIQGLQARLDASEAQRKADNAPPLVGIAASVRDNLQAHAAANPGTDHTKALGLAGDLVDAAKNAAESLSGGLVAKLAARLTTALGEVDPGPGDHHWYRQALDFLGAHLAKGLQDLEDQADTQGGTKPAGPVTQAGTAG